MYDWVSLLCSIIAIVFAASLFYYVLKYPEGTEEMKRISSAIREGAKAYLKRQYSVLIVFIAIMSIVLGLALSILDAVAFIFGGILSILSGYIGMTAATKANVRTTEAVKKGLDEGLRVAFVGGCVMGCITVGLGLLGISIFYLIYGTEVASFIAAFGLGASSVALFARVGGGIYTKAADVGADLVGKVEAGIPEDDPRNPAVIADNVGDNVGDVAGMGADLLESYISAVIAVMVLAAVTFKGELIVKGMIVPLLIASMGIISSLVGYFLVRIRKGEEGVGALVKALRKGIYTAAVLHVIFSFLVVYYYLGPEYIGVFYAMLAGLVAGLLIDLNTQYFTSDIYNPTKNLARASLTGTGTTIISGLALGMLSTAVPVVAVAIATYVAYLTAGLYGIAMAGAGMLAILSITLASDAYGPVADNAAGIAEMAHLGEKIRDRASDLDELGNTTAATGKGFAIGSAALTTLGWIVSYLAVVNAIRMKAGVPPLELSFTDPKVIVGMFIGGLVPFVFCAVELNSVGKAAFHIVNEVRRQFREIPGLMEGKAKPDYARCVDITTRFALKEMLIPGSLAVIIPIIVGLALGAAALAGFLVTATVTGFLLAIFMANAGGAWDNAKKYIEKGNLGGKGSDAHKSAVVGDTVGDPLKDTAGPSLNILIKIMSKVALVFAIFFAFI